MVSAADTPDYASTWGAAMTSAWSVPEPIRPSAWSERHRWLYRSSIPGPWRNDNAPHARGLMDIPTRPGCVQANLKKGAQVSGSEILRNLIGYWAHTDPKPVGLTLPSRDKGRKIVKTDILPLFRRTGVLRDLIGSESRDALIETIDLRNGFHLGLMWSGSAASTASDPYAVVINDEVDKMEEWAGDEPDVIGRTEKRLTTYGDRRLQYNVSTPTTAAGKIHRLFEQSTVKLYFYVPCPHCGQYQRLVWTQFKWAKPADVERWLAAAVAAAAGGALQYDDAGHVERFADAGHLAARIAWLEDVRRRMAAVSGKGQMADVLAFGREHLVWYQCAHCPGRIFDQEKSAVIRKGRWSTEQGFVTDFWGKRHEDAETVERRPHETRIGFQIAAWYSLFLHWGTIIGEFLLAEGDLQRAFNWRTERAGEAYEFHARRLTANIFTEKVERAPLPAGICPAWAWVLLATIDTQMDHFYAVIRAWGAGMRSQRVYHGKLLTFEELDRLLFVTTFPVAGGQLAPMRVARTLIDSGGTEDRLLDTTRTQQVYDYVLPRQPVVTAIKVSNRPGPGLYWPMKRQLHQVGTPAGAKADANASLAGWMVDHNRAHDLLATQIVAGVPKRKPLPNPAAEAAARAFEAEAGIEQWTLNQQADADYAAQMASLHKTAVRDGRQYVEAWKPVHGGARHDYRECEAYQVIAAYMANVHLLPAEPEVLAWKEQERASAAATSKRIWNEETPAEAWTPRPL